MQSILRKTGLWIPLVPAVVFVLGVASNQAVLIANHDRFPILINERRVIRLAEPVIDISKMVIHERVSVDSDGTIMLDDVHCLMTSDTHLNALADVWDLGSIYSVGDFAIEAGAYLFDYAIVIWLAFMVSQLCSRSS